MASAGARASVAVHSVGKLKTAAQLISIPMLLFHQPLFGVVPTQRIGTWLIWVAAGLTLWSMFYYLRQAWPHLRDAD
jgi:phosphatidylglycerophosphate synthase